MRYSGLKTSTGWASSSPDMSSVRQKPSSRNGASLRAWIGTGTSRARSSCGIHSMSGATRACTLSPRLRQGGSGIVVQGDRPWRFAGIEARDAVEPGLDERRLERLQPPVRSREQRAEPGLNPFVHLRHGGELAIERRDVGARPLRYERAIASKKEMIVQVALGHAPEGVQIASLQSALKRRHRKPRLRNGSGKEGPDQAPVCRCPRRRRRQSLCAMRSFLVFR